MAGGEAWGDALARALEAQENEAQRLHLKGEGLSDRALDQAVRGTSLDEFHGGNPEALVARCQLLQLRVVRREGDACPGSEEGLRSGGRTGEGEGEGAVGRPDMRSR